MFSRVEGGIEATLPSWRQPWSWLLVAVFVWCAWALAGLLLTPPFHMAMDQAALAGDWPRDQVHLDRGSYGYRLVYSVASARVLVDTPEGRVAAEIHLLHVPILGWSVRSFRHLGAATEIAPAVCPRPRPRRAGHSDLSGGG